MKIAHQIEIIVKIITKLLLSGKNYSIFIDVKRSQVHYLKYVDNKDIAEINVRKGDSHAIS